MPSFRDWPRTLKPASYRGVPFFVESDEIETGRRLEVHEFPHADDPYVEDLGRKANIINVSAYIVSDEADALEKALRRACGAGGAALLSLPMERMQAHCDSCRRAFERDRLGYIAFDLSFVRAGLNGGAFPLGFVASLVASLVDRIGSPLTTSVAAAYRAIGVPSLVSDAAIAALRGFAALVDDMLRTRPYARAALPDLHRRVADIYSRAEEMISAGAVPDRIGDRSYIAAAVTADLSPLVSAITGLVADLARATDEEPLASVDVLVSFGLDGGHAAATPTRGLIRANTKAIEMAVRVSALASFAARVAETRYDDPRSARQARADVAELFDAERARLVPWRDHALSVLLADIAGRTAEYLSALIIDLAPVVTVESNASMPSLWWAQRLYGGPARADELVRRNGVPHPSFMPLSFEALSR